MLRGWRLSLLSVIPFSLLLLLPTHREDRNELSEREIKFTGSRASAGSLTSLLGLGTTATAFVLCN